MKIAIISDNAGWVFDSIAKDFKKGTIHTIVDLNSNPDIIWCLNFWALNKLKNRKNVVAHLHHINTEKIKAYDFSSLKNSIACIVPNKITQQKLKKLTGIDSVKMPYWLLSNRMSPSQRNRRGEIKDFKDQILIGSFQKDSNTGTIIPKKPKGPDILVRVMENIKNCKAVLAGYERGFVINELKKKGIPYVYYEKDNDINSLYDALDWYIVTSREEGGPQAILEAPYRNVDLLSSPVGMAPEILHPSCLCYGVDDFVQKINSNNAKTNFSKKVVQEYVPQNIIPIYDEFFTKIRR